jgi:hypothetical protein
MISACLLMAGHDRSLVAPPDPVLEISSRWVLWGIGGISGLIGLVCVFARREFLPLFLLAWFTFSLLIYRAGYFLLGTMDVQAYVAMTAADYGMSARSFLVLLTTAFTVLGIVSWGRLILLLRPNRPHADQPSIAALTEAN